MFSIDQFHYDLLFPIFFTLFRISTPGTNTNQFHSCLEQVQISSISCFTFPPGFFYSFQHFYTWNKHISVIFHVQNKYRLVPFHVLLFPRFLFVCFFTLFSIFTLRTSYISSISCSIFHPVSFNLLSIFIPKTSVSHLHFLSILFS